MDKLIEKASNWFEGKMNGTEKDHKTGKWSRRTVGWWSIELSGTTNEGMKKLARGEKSAQLMVADDKETTAFL